MSGRARSRGPWHVKRIGNSPDNRIGNIVDADGRIICTFYGNSQYRRLGNETMEANARTLAIAAELEELAEAIAFGHYTAPPGLINEAKALLRKRDQ